MRTLRSVSLTVCIAIFSYTLLAQQHTPIKWSFSAAPSAQTEAVLYFTATMEDGWHIYSQYLEEGGPMPTAFSLHPSPDFEPIGKVKEESSPIKSYDQTFLMDIVTFERVAVFTQRIKLKKKEAIVKGTVEFMVCREDLCLPPESVSFSIETKAKNTELKREPAEQRNKDVRRSQSQGKRKNEKFQSSEKVRYRSTTNDSSILVGKKNSQNEHTEPADSGSLWIIFFGGIAGGLTALLMPCIFPMIPFVVGYFIKRSGSQRQLIISAFLYGLSIVTIYTGVGLTITLLFGSDALNALSTNGFFNLFLFSVLIVFAASLLGGFEITLPSSWITKVDAQSDRKGFAGIFFMAATLALVSFSCTGPLVGSLLVTSTKMGFVLPTVVGMLGFSLALALPFTLFAMFPSLLKKLPKSGNWLNSVKVVLGMLEILLALKFLSNVDLAYHWGIVDREVVIAIAIIVFSLIGIYLLGKLKLPNDGELINLSPLRLFLAVGSLSFSIYLVPGLWGAPLKSVAAFLPPPHTQDFDLYSSSLMTDVNLDKKKYDEVFAAPYGLNAFFDYEEAVAYAKKVNKPVLIDFTGHACMNCRKMEMNVWSDRDVLRRLREDFVLVQLYVDDKTMLPLSEQRISEFSGKMLRTLGSKWSDFQASMFNTNSQPYYVMLDQNTKELLAPGKGAEYDVEEFQKFLSRGSHPYYEHQ